MHERRREFIEPIQIHREIYGDRSFYTFSFSDKNTKEINLQPFITVYLIVMFIY